MLKLIYILILILILISCTTDPSDDMVSISGTVRLEGMTDHSGVEIALYRLADIDPVILEKYTNYGIGVRISQETEFDHRLQPYIRRMIEPTGADGRFSFTGLGSDNYILVFIREGYSLKYMRASKDMNVEMFKAIEMGNIVPESFIFESGRQYNFISRNTSISNVTVTIQAGAILTVGVRNSITFNNAEIIVPSPLYIEPQFWWVTSSFGLDSFDSYQQLEIDMFFDSIHISSTTEAVLSGAKITFINEGIRMSAPEVIVSNSYFNHSTNLFRFDRGRVVVRNVMNQDSRNSSFVMEVANAPTNNFIFVNNISHSNDFHSGSVNIELFHTDATIQNNYFRKNRLAIRTNLNKIYILNNEFNDNTASYDNRGSNSSIRENKFMGVRLREIVMRRSVGGIRAFGVVNRNNFHERTRTLLSMGMDSDVSAIVMVQDNIDSSNNYFARPDVSTQIRDRNRPGLEGLMFEFQITNRQDRAFTDIGIQRFFEN